MSEEDREWLDQLIRENKDSDNELTYTYCPFSVLYALQQENKKLHNKIDKAIDLLQQYLPNYASCVKLLDELEEILKDGGVDVKDKR